LRLNENAMKGHNLETRQKRMAIKGKEIVGDSYGSQR